jgi:hypothetical protein
MRTQLNQPWSKAESGIIAASAPAGTGAPDEAKLDRPFRTIQSKGASEEKSDSGSEERQAATHGAPQILRFSRTVDVAL